METRVCVDCEDDLCLDRYEGGRRQCRSCRYKAQSQRRALGGGKTQKQAHAQYKHGSRTEEKSKVDRKVLADTYRLYRKRLRILSFCGVGIHDSTNYTEIEATLAKHGIGSTFHWDGVNDFIQKAAENG
jgi:hypothetical protein